MGLRCEIRVIACFRFGHICRRASVSSVVARAVPSSRTKRTSCCARSDRGQVRIDSCRGAEEGTWHRLGMTAVRDLPPSARALCKRTEIRQQPSGAAFAPLAVPYVTVLKRFCSRSATFLLFGCAYQGCFQYWMFTNLLERLFPGRGLLPALRKVLRGPTLRSGSKTRWCTRMCTRCWAWAAVRRCRRTRRPRC